MTPRRLLTILIAAATTLALAPTAHADTRHQPSSEAVHWMIEANRAVSHYYFVWDQTSNPGRPTLAWEFHGRQHQRWTFEGNSIKNVDNGWCATAVDGYIHGRDCDGSSAQRWGWAEHGYYVYQLRNEASGTCATFNGGWRQIILLPCEDNDAQYWKVFVCGCTDTTIARRDAPGFSRSRRPAEGSGSPPSTRT